MSRLAPAAAIVIAVALVCITSASEEWTRPEGCLQPAETGVCEALIYRYAYKVSSDQCEQFVFGGCDANFNNFESQEECEQRCKPPPSPPSDEE
ncbi:hypothetical protein R5R35_014648 [Gryllus longicercus]|uniref:BPTI/Kunitz inhibitor domain-containing protein n=1 Tax=Gryllus longicercus TaxID=2509291 RepID=A0AAN9VVV0_9ORTH